LFVRYIAFLRAINVGKHIVKMDRLRQLFTDLGLTNVETFIASGNVIFDSRSADAEALEARIERGLKKALGYDVGVFLRSCEELAAIAAHEPLASARGAASSGREDACTRHVVFLKAAADQAVKTKIAALRTMDDDFHAHRRELYWKTRASFQSPVAVPFGKIVGSGGTMRNLTTVRKLAAKYKP
jgi:uncharacterized protein (DUF1697 family)